MSKTAKTIQRWKNTPPSKTIAGSKEGIVKDATIAKLIGEILVAWPHFEDEMISVFHNLLGAKLGDLETARLIFSTLVNQRVRIKVMQQLLTRSRLNKDKKEDYEIILSEFEKLNDQRNKYVHGLWWTHESGDTYIQTDNSVFFTHAIYQKITKADLEFFLKRLNNLRLQVIEL